MYSRGDDSLSPTLARLELESLTVELELDLRLAGLRHVIT